MNIIDPNRPVIALGLMSGTSLDGVDAALLETDGKKINDTGPAITVPYPDDFRSRLAWEVGEAGAHDRPTQDVELIRDLTRAHVQAVETLLRDLPEDSKWSAPAVIGFHGHTTLHRPERNFTQQIGDPILLAQESGLPVVSDFRQADVEQGGEGAPLAPVFHSAMLLERPKPIAVINIGGLSNVTWIGEEPDALVAFDTGPGNGLLDAWIEQKAGARFDQDGEIASRGQIAEALITKSLENPFFSKPWPKSLDRSDFTIEPYQHLNVQDGAATLVELTARTIAFGLEQCPVMPVKAYVTGGGRHNTTLMGRLLACCPCPVEPIDVLEWNGDSVEAQAFAFMAVRSVHGLPLTYAGTTGVKRPMTGGKLVQPQS